MTVMSEINIKPELAEHELLEELANLNPPNCAFNTRNMLRALELFGHPERSYPVIHIAGTNGKGSTAAFIEAGLLAHGLRVAKFTSPYLHHVTECIMVNQQAISAASLAALYAKLKPQLAAAEIALSSFEMLTLLMFVHCGSVELDYLVLETGMGGRDDATNVVNSQYSVITNISLEHTQWLGDSLAAIAEHKAGIIQPTSRCILADECVELQLAAAQRSSEITNVLKKYEYQTSLCTRLFTTQLDFAPRSDPSALQRVSLGLFGHFQARNFLAAYEVLKQIGIPQATIFASAATVRWPGRLQLIRSAQPTLLADAAHNPAGCANLYASMHANYPAANGVIVAAILADKEVSGMLTWYAKIASRIIFCRLVEQPRALEPTRIAELAAGMFSEVFLRDTPVEALQLAEQMGSDWILISGSTYLLKHFI